MKKLLNTILILSFLCSDCAFLSAKEASLPNNNEVDYYKIAVGDKIDINVYEEPDLSGTFEVKEDGAIAFPLIGDVKIVDMTKKEVEDKISELLKDGYLVNPYVRVSVGKFGTRNILIMGHVGRPGSYPLPEDGNPTILKAIAESGGFTAMADINGTRIIRTISGGKKVTINPHMSAIITGREQDISLEPGDLIIVPERLF